MKRMTVAEVKAQFSRVLDEVEAGEEIAITYGRKKEVKALLVPQKTKKEGIKLGILEGKASFKIKDDFKITEEELLGL